MTISAQGIAIIPSGPDEEEVYQNGCLLTISKETPIPGEYAEVFWVGRSSIWNWKYGFRYGGWEDEHNYYVPVPEGSSVTVVTIFNTTSKLAELGKYGILYSSERGVTVQFNVSCSTQKTNVAYLVAKNIRESLEAFKSKEKEDLRKTGFDAERYLKEVEYAIMLLRESEEAFNKRSFEVGFGLFEKGFVKTINALEVLSQAKTDCIACSCF